MSKEVSRRSFLGTAASTAGVGLGSTALSSRQVRADPPPPNLFPDPHQLVASARDLRSEPALPVQRRSSKSHTSSGPPCASPNRCWRSIAWRYFGVPSPTATAWSVTRAYRGMPECLYMGYGLKVFNGVIELSCVADQAAVANAVLEACLFAQDPLAIDRWRQCIVDWVDWVKANFLNTYADGSASVGVGVFAHMWNPINPYWCATALFATSLFKLARLTDPGQVHSTLARVLIGFPSTTSRTRTIRTSAMSRQTSCST